ncbi:MAG: amidohydrolase family protein [Longimicrobiales bacterium]
MARRSAHRPARTARARRYALRAAAVLGAGALALVLIAVLVWRPTRLPRAEPFALAGTTVINVSDGTRSAGTTVFVRGGRIAWIGPDAAAALPPETRVLDARGSYVLPGFWDMHVHGVLGGGQARINRNLLVAHGITGVRAMGTHLSPADVARGMVEPSADPSELGPRVVASGRIVNGPESIVGFNLVAGAPEQGRAAVDSLADGGADLVKVYNLLPAAAYFAVLARAGERGLPVAGHVPFAVSAALAADSGHGSIEHLTGIALHCSSREAELRDSLLAVFHTSRERRVRHATVDRVEHEAHASYDGTKCGALASRFVGSGTWQTPTLVQLRRSAGDYGRLASADPRFNSMPRWAAVYRQRRAQEASWSPADAARRRATFDAERRLDARMNAAGVRFLAGTDMPSLLVFPGSSLHEELALLVDAGLTPLQALQAATINPARLLGATDSLGTVTAGKVADLVVLDHDPLDDIENTRAISAVVLRGRLLQRPALDRLIEQTHRLAGRGRIVERMRQWVPFL